MLDKMMGMSRANKQRSDKREYKMGAKDDKFFMEIAVLFMCFIGAVWVCFLGGEAIPAKMIMLCGFSGYLFYLGKFFSWKFLLAFFLIEAPHIFGSVVSGWAYYPRIFTAIFYVAAIFLYASSEKNINKPMEAPSWYFLAGLFLTRIFFGIAAVFIFHKEAGDVGTSTLNAIDNLLSGINPYTAPEIPVWWHDVSIHQQNFAYPPAMMILYLPFKLFFNFLGVVDFTKILLFTNLIYNALCVFFIYHIVSFKEKLVAPFAVALFLISPLMTYEGVAAGTNDIAVITIVLASLYFCQREKWIPGMIFLAIATFSKWFAGVFMVVFLIRFLFRKDIKKIVLSLAIMCVAFLIFFGPFLYLNHQEFLADLRWQSIRPVEGWERGIFATMQPFILFVVCLFLYERRALKNFSNGFYFSGIIVLSFLFFQRVYHQNHVVWVIPFLCILPFPSSDEDREPLRTELFFKKMWLKLTGIKK